VLQLTRAVIFEFETADITGVGTISLGVFTIRTGAGLLDVSNADSYDVSVTKYRDSWTSGENVVVVLLVVLPVMKFPDASMINEYVRPGYGCDQFTVKELNVTELEDISFGAGILVVVNVGLVEELLKRSK
jgi:hypothetical protein